MRRTNEHLKVWICLLTCMVTRAVHLELVQDMMTEKLLLAFKVSKGAKIRSRYNQVPQPTQDTNGKVTNSQ